jgi:hypothetical protein
MRDTSPSQVRRERGSWLLREWFSLLPMHAERGRY